MKLLILILTITALSYSCDSIPVWIIERHNCTKIWHWGKWIWRVREGGTIKIDRDTVCNIYIAEKGTFLHWCNDTCEVTKVRYYSDTSYSVLREE